MINLISA